MHERAALALERLGGVIHGVVAQLMPFGQVAVHVGVEVLDAVAAHEEGRVGVVLLERIQQPDRQSIRAAGRPVVKGQRDVGVGLGDIGQARQAGRLGRDGVYLHLVALQHKAGQGGHALCGLAVLLAQGARQVADLAVRRIVDGLHRDVQPAAVLQERAILIGQAAVRDLGQRFCREVQAAVLHDRALAACELHGFISQQHRVRALPNDQAVLEILLDRIAQLLLGRRLERIDLAVFQVPDGADDIAALCRRIVSDLAAERLGHRAPRDIERVAGARGLDRQCVALAVHALNAVCVLAELECVRADGDLKRLILKDERAAQALDQRADRDQHIAVIVDIGSNCVALAVVHRDDFAVPQGRAVIDLQHELMAVRFGGKRGQAASKDRTDRRRNHGDQQHDDHKCHACFPFHIQCLLSIHFF